MNVQLSNDLVILAVFIYKFSIILAVVWMMLHSCLLLENYLKQ